MSIIESSIEARRAAKGRLTELREQLNHHDALAGNQLIVLQTKIMPYAETIDLDTEAISAAAKELDRLAKEMREITAGITRIESFLNG